MKKILIVEDEAEISKLLSAKLKESNFEVLHAANGKAGLDAALKEHPDLILLDIMMPKMNGLEVLKALRQDDWGKEVPIFMLTNYDSLENISEGVKNHAQEFLVKSNWKLDDIVKKVKSVMENTKIADSK